MIPHVYSGEFDSVSSARLYTGNLSYGTSEASLRTALELHGEVTSVTISSPIVTPGAPKDSVSWKWAQPKKPTRPNALWMALSSTFAPSRSTPRGNKCPEHRVQAVCSAAATAAGEVASKNWTAP